MTREAFYLVDDFKIKIEQLLKPGETSLSSQSREIFKLIYKHVESFEETAKTTLHTDVDRAIRWEVYKLQSIVARLGSFQYSDVYESEDDDEEEDDDDDQEENDDAEEEEDDDEEDDDDDDDDAEEGEEEDDDGLEFSLEEVEKLKQRMQSFTTRLKMIKERCVDGLYNSFPDDEEDDKGVYHDAVSSEVIGLRDVYEELKEKVMDDHLTSLIGMPGIGKTALAKKFFHDPTTVKCFNHRVWVRVGKKCRVKDIPRRILEEINPDSLLTLPEGDEEAVNESLKACLKGKSYLIVLDDVWDRYITQLLHLAFRFGVYDLKHPFLRWQSKSRILLTSRLQQLYRDPTSLITFDCIVNMRLLNKDESWSLLCDKLFGKGSLCPPQLEKAGKKISENCEGLPLTILTVARLLSEEHMTTIEFWNEVASKKNHRLFIAAYDEISKVLLPSYTYLPRLLQLCFLYIGLFPQNYEIPRSKLTNLWLSDRFLESSININSYKDVVHCLEELVTNSVLRVYKQSTFNGMHTVKTCGLHSSLWYLSKLKVREETNFALALRSPNDCLGDGMQGYHRVAINSNVLFGMKVVHKSVEDNCASAARSLLCFGPYLQYQVPLCFRLKLLRELDALSIRFYEFPVEVLQLAQLTYLSLTSNGMIPPSISQLQFLKFFIVDRHQSIKSCKDASLLPVEIWSLPELQHLQVMGSDLPDPHGASLESLSTLSNVSARSCTEAILKGVPYLNVLRILIELAPDDVDKPLNCFAQISHLSELHKLKCVVANPEVVPPIVPFQSFPECLQILSLSGLGYSWKEMKKLASLPDLRVLKLKSFAFQGPEWEVEETGFANLISLVIEDSDLVAWKFGRGAFRGLGSLKIKHCFKLEKIHGQFGQYLRRVELVDCNPSCAAEMKKATTEKATICILHVHSSWDDKELKT